MAGRSEGAEGAAEPTVPAEARAPAAEVRAPAAAAGTPAAEVRTPAVPLSLPAVLHSRTRQRNGEWSPPGARVGLDVGGTKTEAILLAPDGTVRARRRCETGAGADAVVGGIVAVARAVASEAGIDIVDLGSVGIGIPGYVEDGRVRHAVNLGVEELDLATVVAGELGTAVHVENDVKAAAVGAAALHGQARDMAYLNLGTGVAAGIVTDGELWRGSRGAAGEVGHVAVDPAGPLCRCGQRGCIEAFAGGRALAARWGVAGAVPVRDVFDAADAGDPRALLLRGELAFGVASAVRVLVLTADVDIVMIGGGVAGLGERLLRDVRAALEVSAAASPFLRSLGLAGRVELLPAGSPAAALGAALVGAGREAGSSVAYGANASAPHVRESSEESA